MLVLAVLSLVAATIRADSFSVVDQAIWIDRHNYFRTTGLPWSAGNMRRIGWSAKLASSAASTATQCSSSSGPGVNVYQSSLTDSPTLIDEAIEQWVVTTSKSTLKRLPQPGASNVDIGTGSYNTYSQILWASTTSVGCAKQSCPGGDVVVCEYSPAGNDGSSPWYNHAATASKCPSGTKALQGLCIVEGDAANNVIAPIPAGKLTYKVYPAYVSSIQVLLLETARAIATKKATTHATTALASTPPSSKTPLSSRDGKRTPQTTPSPASGRTATKTRSSASTTRATSPVSSPRSDAPQLSPTASDDSSGSEASQSTPGTDSRPSPKKKTAASDASDASGLKSGKVTMPSTGSKAATSPVSNSDSATVITPSSDSSGDSSTNQTLDASDADGMEPGTVKASSDTGIEFTNQDQGTGITIPTPVAPGAPALSNVPENISNQSSVKKGGGISATGVAAVIVLVVGAVAALGVIVSYRRNQQRQREIMRDGGIQII